MPSATLPDDEEARLRALLDLDVLDTSAETEFDELVQAASLVCQAPVSLISLIDAERQWFKARLGLDDVTETPRDVAFCSYAIHHDDILEVTDATRDARFADNPLVRGDPSIRFYAGAPLQLSTGERIGTLCVIDRKPRRLDDHQREVLALLASVAVRGLERRRDARMRAQLESKVRRLVDDSRADLQVQNLRKNRFMAVLSHELRGPLSAMVSGLGLLKLDRQLSEPSTKALAVLQRQVTLMTDLVSDLLDVSRIGEGKVDLSLAPVDLNDIVALAAETTLELVTAKRHVVEFDRADGSLTTHADRRRLVQLVSNLMANAAKYSPAESHITIRTLRDERHAVLQVIDNGIGIDAAALETVFNPFEQLDEGLHLSQGGLGIGLSLVRQIAELHGGTVDAASAGRGRGATFSVHLPLMPPAGAPRT